MVKPKRKSKKLMVIFAMLAIAISGTLLVSHANVGANAYANEQSGINVNTSQDRESTVSDNYSNAMNVAAVFNGDCYIKNPFLFHLHHTGTQIRISEMPPMMLMGYSLYNFPESKQAVIDFTSRYPSVVPLVIGIGGDSVQQSWDGENYFDVNGNVIQETEFGAPYGFYIFDLDYDGIPEIVMFYLAPPILGHPSTSTVVYQYRDGEFRPMPVYLHSLIDGIYFAVNTPPQGEYSYLMPFAAKFYDCTAYFLNLSDKLYMFTTAHEFDVAGEWYVKIYNGALYFEPMRVIRDSESLG